MHIDLSRVANTKGHHHISPYWSRKEFSSASYGAKLLADGSGYVIFRFPTEDSEYMLLGRVANETLAEARLDWWVRNDGRMRALVKAALKADQPVEILDLVLESATSTK